MSHTTTAIRAQQTKPLPAELRVREARAELEHLGGLLDAAKKEREACEADVKSHAAAKRKLAELTARCDEKEEVVAKLEKHASDLEGRAAKAKGALSDVEEAHAELVEAHEKRTREHRELAKRVAEMKKVLEAGGRELRNRLEADFADVRRKIVDANAELSRITHHIESARRELAERNEEKKTMRVMGEKLAQVQVLFSELARKVEEERANLRSVNSENERVAESIKTRAARFEERCQEKERALSERQKELEKREGVVSERESWVASKEEKLAQTKLELERFYGRKITHVGA